MLGNDTAAYAGPLAQSAVTFNFADNRWEVNGGALGTDVLHSIEYVAFSGGRYLLVDPNGTGANGFASLNDAVLASSQSGDTIIFATAPTGPVNIDDRYRPGSRLHHSVQRADHGHVSPAPAAPMSPPVMAKTSS